MCIRDRTYTRRMQRFFRFAAAVAVACAVANVHAQPPAQQTVLQRFLARAEEPPVEYRALRRLEAQNPKFKQSAWMQAWTEYDHEKGFQYQICLLYTSPSPRDS